MDNIGNVTYIAFTTNENLLGIVRLVYSFSSFIHKVRRKNPKIVSCWTTSQTTVLPGNNSRSL